MAQESKVIENVTASKAAEKKLYVSREVFGKSDSGEDLYSYYIDATFRGQKNRISLQAEDNGSYSMLNIIFANALMVEARFVESVFKPDEDSAPIVTLSVEVFVFDENDGVEYSAPLKGQRKSDKTCLANLYQLYKAKKPNK